MFCKQFRQLSCCSTQSQVTRTSRSKAEGKEGELSIRTCASRCVTFILIAIGLVLIASQANATPSAGWVFYKNIPGNFYLESQLLGYRFVGVEYFEQAILAPNTLTALNDPLTQGVSNGPFPSGLTFPLTVQSNMGGADRSSPNPRGANGLLAISPGWISHNNCVRTYEYPDSLDLIFDVSDQIVGVGFTTFETAFPSVREVQVFNQHNTLVADLTIDVPRHPLEVAHVGFVLTSGDVISRINLFAPKGSELEAVDNVALFTAKPIPEPASLGLLGLGACALLGVRPRRQRCA